MNKLYLLSSAFVALVLFCVGCGTGNNRVGTGFGGGGTAGSFSNSSLSGNYTYQVTGYDLTTGVPVPFRESGAFLADGKGNITGGEDDFAEGTTVALASPVTSGSYQVSNDGTGALTLNFSSGSLLAAITVQSAPTVYMAVTAPANSGALINGTGVALAQTTSAFSSLPSGTFVFRTHAPPTTVRGASATVGAFTVSGGAVGAGNEDQWQNSAVTQLTLTGGSFVAPDTFGRGTLTLTDNTPATATFSYYLADSSHLYLFSTVNGSIGIGQAEAQSGTFSASSLSGSYVFGSRGDDSFSVGGVDTVGQFSAGNGAISGGQFDSVQDGSVVSPGTFSSSSYTVASNGRAVVNLAPSTGIAIQEILWMVSPSRAFLLTNDTTKVEDGTVDLQQSTSFSKSSLNGQFGFAMDGFLIPAAGAAPFYDRVGYLHWDGAGNLGLKELVNISGIPQTPGILNGSYTVGGNGRVTGNVSSLSGNLIFYLISNNQAYMLQGDTGVEINGMMGTIP